MQRSDENLRRTTILILEGRKDPLIRGKGLMGWLRGGKEREGD